MRQTGARKSIRSLIGFELFMKVACLSFGFPTVRFMMQVCMKASGFSYLTKENLFAFLVSPLTLFCMLAVLSVTSFVVLFEMNAVALAIRSRYNGCPFTVSELFFGGMQCMKTLFRKKKSGVLLALLTLLFTGIVNIPLVLFFFFGMRQTESLTRVVMQPIGIVSVVIVAMLLWWIALLGCAVVLLPGIEKGDLRSQIKNSQRGVKDCYGRIIKGLFGRGLVLFLLEGVFYMVGLVVFVAILLFVTSAEVSGVLLLRASVRYHVIVCLLFASVNAVIYEYFCGVLFFEYRKKEEAVSLVKAGDLKLSKTRKRSAAFCFAMLFVFCVAITETVFFFQSGNVVFAEALDRLCITAHRGASDAAPENTLAAIELAVEEGADYVEIDVRMTADRVPVLLHDEALFRTTRVLEEIGDVTYAETAEYDAGSSFSSAYAGERVPSLEEVLEQFGGKIGFNIELKSTQDRGLAEQVVELIEAYHLEKSCVITSASYEQLEWVKEENSALKTGYILSLVYGNFYECEAADFFSIRSDFVSEQLVEMAHSKGKEVHAWTVNNYSELRRMKTVGVDNIITDRPAYAREVVFESKLSESIEAFLSLVLSKK